MEFFKKNKKIIITAIISFLVGTIAASGGVSQEEYNSVKSDLEASNLKVAKLEAKVEQAKPFFEMKDSEKEAMKVESAKKEEEKKQAELEAKSVELSSGNYISGKDFEPGTYNIVAIDGGGNVSSSNMFTGGINAVMGPQNDGFYEKEYKNIKLPEQTELQLSGVTIKLTPIQ